MFKFKLMQDVYLDPAHWCKLYAAKQDKVQLVRIVKRTVSEEILPYSTEVITKVTYDCAYMNKPDGYMSDVEEHTLMENAPEVKPLDITIR